MLDNDARANILSDFGASSPEIRELLAYNENRFDWAAVQSPLMLPLEDEPHVEAWAGYAKEGGSRGVFAVLRDKLVQLRFPIGEGISKTPGYRAATRHGRPPAEIPEATGLQLHRPEALELQVHATPAGRVPVLIARDRADFIALVRALAGRNEPLPVPQSQGACMVVGFNNWDRIRTHRSAWEAAHPAEAALGGWDRELKRLIPQKARYQDRFMILSDGPYSAVRAADLGLSDHDWRELSLVIRRDHECAHYFTSRLLGSMQNNLLDELIADYAGIVAAVGRYRSDWFLRSVGLESFPHYHNM